MAKEPFRVAKEEARLFHHWARRASFREKYIVKNKRDARVAYYEGVKRATLEHIKATEDGLRSLKDVRPEKIEKLIADVHKRHMKLLKLIDRHIKEESRS